MDQPTTTAVVEQPTSEENGDPTGCGDSQNTSAEATPVASCTFVQTNSSDSSTIDTDQSPDQWRKTHTHKPVKVEVCNRCYINKTDSSNH